MARLARSVYRSNNGHRRGNRAEPQFSRRGNPLPGAPARGRPSSPGQRPSAQSPGKLRSMRAVVSNRMSPPVRDRRCSHRHRRATRSEIADRQPQKGAGTAGAPVSDRHRAAARNPHRRRWPPQSHGGAPVSDRHRAAARNPHRRRWPPQSHGQERRSPTGIARERETRTDDAGHPNLTAWSASLRPASRGSAKPAPTTLATPISRLGAPEWPLSWPHQPALRSCRQPKPEPRRGDVMNPFHPGGWPSFRCRLTTGAPGALRHTDWFRETAGKPRRSRGRARSPHSRTTVVPGRPPAPR